METRNSGVNVENVEFQAKNVHKMQFLDFIIAVGYYACSWTLRQ